MSTAVIFRHSSQRYIDGIPYNNGYVMKALHMGRRALEHKPRVGSERLYVFGHLGSALLGIERWRSSQVIPKHNQMCVFLRILHKFDRIVLVGYTALGACVKEVGRLMGDPAWPLLAHPLRKEALVMIAPIEDEPAVEFTVAEFISHRNLPLFYKLQGIGRQQGVNLTAARKNIRMCSPNKGEGAVDCDEIESRLSKQRMLINDEILLDPLPPAVGSFLDELLDNYLHRHNHSQALTSSTSLNRELMFPKGIKMGLAIDTPAHLAEEFVMWTLVAKGTEVGQDDDAQEDAKED